MSKTSESHPGSAGVPGPWDARAARWLVSPFRDSWVTPNHLTTVRLVVGLAATLAIAQGSYGWSNVGSLLLALSNFLDHADGELARISGKTSRFGHLYDLACDAVITILLFLAIGIGLDAHHATLRPMSPVVQGLLAGTATALIFVLRLRIEEMAGKSATKQASLGGFETEDLLYLLPLVTLVGGLAPFLTAASIGAPLFAIWVIIDYRRHRRLRQSPKTARTSEAAR